MKDEVELFLTVKAISENSVKVTDGDVTCWLPKKEIDAVGVRIEDINRGDEEDFLVPVWLAKNEGLI